jgi:hypothetical protein
MVTGIEAAGLALAILPLLINQIDAYALGIEKIRLLRRYRRDFKGYSMGLKTQRTILQNTLEQALEGVVDDEDEIHQLINNPQGEVWANAALQSRLRRKLNRNYDVFLQNMTSLSDLLEYLSRKLHIGEDWANVSDLFFYSYTIFRVVLTVLTLDHLSPPLKPGIYGNSVRSLAKRYTMISSQRSMRQIQY